MTIVFLEMVYSEIWTCLIIEKVLFSLLGYYFLYI